MSIARTYYLIVFAIIAISLIDAYLNVAFPVHAAIEKNPLAKEMLIYMNDNLSLFITIKLIGTALVGVILVYLYRHFRIAWAVIIPVLIIQIGVISYLISP
jgi:Sec-independent protein secretion pathway component TatC